MSPEAHELRRRAARADCDVTVADDIDGLSTLSALLPTADAYSLLSAVNAVAEGTDTALAAGEGRVEALKALILGSVGGPAPVVAHVDVVVGLETMLGIADQPAVIAGNVPLSSPAVRELIGACAPGSSFRRLVIDPDGSLLDLGRTRYEITDAQRAFITTRDLTCRFPGCGQRAMRCQADHAVAWDDGGATDVENLGALCVRHHNLKTHGGWNIVETYSDGSCDWTSPLGRLYHRARSELLPAP